MSRIFLLVLILISTKNIFACNWVKPNKITLDSLFSEGVVLQRDKTIAIWGTATENNLPVEVSLQDQNVKTTTENKKWKVEFKPLDAGGPYTLKVSSNTSTLQIPSVYVGDVWLAGGQSNMLWQLKNTVEGKAYIASQSKDDYIRLYKAKLGYNREPNIADCNGISLGTWKAANKDTVPTFSAVAYHFARNLREKLNVPIGIISTPVGGSPIESWISHDYYLK
ncbi:MAG: sialate O-acetylesterase, partial [Bacteriovoracaceae bacterium]